MSESSVEDLVKELESRGYTVTLNGKTISVTGEATQGNSAQAVQQRVFLAFDAVENWLKQDRHRYDLRRNFDEQWLYARAFDWARQPKGYCVDANKSVKIGVGKYDAYEDPTSAQIVIIRHFDSERPGNYEKRNNCKLSGYHYVAVV